jgi:hypothetical protein
MMKIKFLVLLVLASFNLWYCSNQSDKKRATSIDNPIMQQEDGSISLKLANAWFYSDTIDPSNNTAEWTVVISKTGSYRIWLSSATKDTINFNYLNKVKVNLSDREYIVIPKWDKIIQKSEDVSYPYFRADSFVGSFYISQTGEYNIQVTGEKVISEATRNQAKTLTENSKLMALIISPLAKR